MKGNLRLVSVISAIAGLALVAAASPSALSQAQGGLWEVMRAGRAPVRMCLPSPSALAQFEHRNAKCSHSVLRDGGTSATISYNCSPGNFGQSDLTLVTPRSLRVKTQGISGDAPFAYTFQARRVGDCPAH